MIGSLYLGENILEFLGLVSTYFLECGTGRGLKKVVRSGTAFIELVKHLLNGARPFNQGWLCYCRRGWRNCSTGFNGFPRPMTTMGASMTAI